MNDFRCYEEHEQLRWIYTVFAFRLLLSVFVRFFFSVKKYVLIRLHFYMPISALTKLSHAGQKFSEKKTFFL